MFKFVSEGTCENFGGCFVELLCFFVRFAEFLDDVSDNLFLILFADDRMLFEDGTNGLAIRSRKFSFLGQNADKILLIHDWIIQQITFLDCWHAKMNINEAR